ncbi:MAG: HlyD family efflux transporter periplasmic adaptor subunit [Nitrospirota bacterium]|nr:HlyD family efflux transporter periplasmic adaptor subunit [Nitrospirota bacterium]
MKRMLLVMLAGGALFAVVYIYLGATSDRTAESTLKLSGNIEAHESVVSFKLQGRIVELPVQEGQFVKQGDLLARLDDDDYRQQVSVDEATVRAREAELDLALAGSRTQEVQEAKQNVVDAQADLALKQQELRRRRALLAEQGVSQEDVDTVTAELKRARATYERVKQHHDQIVEGTRKEQIVVNRANLQLAREMLEMSRVKLGYTVLKAPIAGVVLVRQAELGEVVVPGTPVVTIADLDHLWLRGYISETDVGRIRWGQPAAVHTDTFPHTTYPGRVSFISSEAEFTPKSVETHKERVTLVYRVKIDLDNPNHELKPGMPADAVIEMAPR